MVVENKFPEILKMLLSENKMTRADLGNAIGMKSNTVSMWCLGRYEPSISTLIKIANYFDVSVDFLLTGEKSINVTTLDDLGLSERALEILKAIAQGKILKGLSGYLDSLICDKDFREAFYGAISELQHHSIRYNSTKAMHDTEDRTLDFDEYMKFLEARATFELHAPLQQYFKRVNYGRKAYGKTPNDCFSETQSEWV